MADILIDIDNLKVSRQNFEVSLPQLRINQGQCVALCGVSGSGKSTLLEAISLLNPWSHIDKYNFNSIDMLKLNHKQLEALRISCMGIMPQVGGLIPFLNLYENWTLQIKLALEHHIRGDQYGFNIVNISSQSEIEGYLHRLLTMIERFNLQDYMYKKPHELSIGQRQRALFIRSIAHEPQFILIDEPTSALDPQNARVLFELIEECAHTLNMGILMVTHDASAVKRYPCWCFDQNLSYGEHAIFTFQGH